MHHIFRCVQKLRKRISLENQTIAVDSVKKGLDRTPSFYTSRSVINLSGLSVSDPIPRVKLTSNKSIRQRRPSNNNDSITVPSQIIEDIHEDDDGFINEENDIDNQQEFFNSVIGHDDQLIDDSYNNEEIKLEKTDVHK